MYASRRTFLAVAGLLLVALVCAGVALGTHAGLESINLRTGARSVTGPGDVRTASTGSASPAELARGRWIVLARSPLGLRYAPVLQWTGSELLEFGGWSELQTASSAARSGAAYSPASGRWRRLANVPAAVDIGDALSFWTGSRLFVLGFGIARPGPADLKTTLRAALYDPVTNRWTVAAKLPTGAFGDSTYSATLVTGARPQIIVAGSNLVQRSCQIARLHVLSYDLSSGRWSVLATPSVKGHMSLSATVLATNDGVLLWSNREAYPVRPRRGACSTIRPMGLDVFRLSSDGHWSNVTARWPRNEGASDPIFTGSQILLPPQPRPCGIAVCMAHTGYFPGMIVNPETLRSRPIARTKIEQFGPQGEIWTGQALIAIDTTGDSGDGIAPGDLAIWNPATNRWTRGRRAPFAPDSIVWGGDRLWMLGVGGRLASFRSR